MLRTFTVEGFVLLADRFGEIHKRISLFTAERGIVSVFAHGALKSAGKLRAVTELFVQGRFSLYHDPVKDTIKITDADCLDSFPFIRTGLRRFYAASLFVELVMKSHGGGEAGRTLYALFSEALALLNDAQEEDVPYHVLQFILRFLNLTGFETLGEECEICHRRTAGTETVWLPRRAAGMVCGACRRESLAEYSPGARAYAVQSRRLPLGEALRLRLTGQALAGFKTLLYILAQDAVERPLSVLDAGRGIL
jgi:DNA repair protein RecO (recombination protein O)